jgi:hypothetical protein
VLEEWPVDNDGMNDIVDNFLYMPIEEEECKIERSFDNDVMEVPKYERKLDAIFYHDDGDERKSLIWVQCRQRKWSTLVEAFVKESCFCNWNHEEKLEREMARLSLLPPPLLEDFDDVSMHNALENIKFNHAGST